MIKIFTVILIFVNYFNVLLAQSNIIQSKNVCMCPSEGGYTTFGCSRNAKIQITNAYTYTNDGIAFCSDETITSNRFFVRDILEAKCNRNRNCTLEYGIFFGPSDVTNENISNCKNANFEWICISSSDTVPTSSPDYNYSSWSMGFTYFFYIITLVLSTTCIVVGAVFLLRRFIIMRRRSRAGGYRARNDRGSLYRFFLRYQNNQNNGNVVAEDTRPPPSYDTVYTVSTAVNPLPSYSAAVHLKSLENPETASSGTNKTVDNTQITQQQQQQDSSIATSTSSTSSSSDVTTATIDNNLTSNFDHVIDCNNSSILNGEINLGFINENEPEAIISTSTMMTTQK